MHNIMIVSAGVRLTHERVRAEARDAPNALRFAALLIIIAATALALGHTLRQPTQMGANDISRWCTVWSLLERGTYVIDECPWQVDTQDKVFRAPKGAIDATGRPGAGPALLLEQARVLADLDRRDSLPGAARDGRAARPGRAQERAPRWTQKPDPELSLRGQGGARDAQEPVRWPAYIFYFKPIVVLLNVIPFGIFLVLFARVLDRYAANDWAWFFCLVAAAFGTYLLPFTQTLNNHTVAAFSAFFALYQLFWIWDRRRTLRLAIRGRGVLRGVRRGERAAGPCVPGLVVWPARRFVFPGKTLLLFPPGGGRFRSPRSWPLSMRSSASSSWPTRRSAPMSISTKEASGRRRWISMRSTIIPSRTRPISST